MAAYTVSITDITDPEQYERYKQLSPATVARYGGRYLTRGGAQEVLEGDWRPPRVVLIEFPSLEAARAWYASPEYTEARRVREGAGTVDIVAVDGVQAPVT
jgi:uncharacterized protein (DUF1330 family)